MSDADLDPDGAAVDLGPEVRLRNPGLVGRATLHERPAPGGSRAGRPAPLPLDEALDDLGVTTWYEVDLEIEGEVERPRPSGVRGDASDALELEVPTPTPDYVQAVLVIDDESVLTWHVPMSTGEPERADRGGGTNRFVIPRGRSAGPGSGDGPADRGAVGRILRKVLKVVVLKAVRHVGGALVAEGVRLFENEKRKYGLRTFGPEDHRGSGTPIHEGWFAGNTGKRHLLFLHGTTSFAARAFGQLDAEQVRALVEPYGGRSFAFDHPTLSQTPADNVGWLRDQIPAGLEVDVVCHSRGGLVARTMAGGMPGIPAIAEVRRVIFVGTPNAGTPLAAPEHIAMFVDVMTNLVSMVPSNGATDVLEVVLEIVKELASGAIAALPGLQSMNPAEGGVIGALNDAPPFDEPRWHAVTSAYRPELPRAWASWVLDQIWDATFGEENDLVVPTKGCFDGPGRRFPRSPEARRLTLSETVHHGEYFAGDAGRTVVKAIRDWLVA